MGNFLNLDTIPCSSSLCRGIRDPKANILKKSTCKVCAVIIRLQRLAFKGKKETPKSIVAHRESIRPKMSDKEVVSVLMSSPWEQGQTKGAA